MEGGYGGYSYINESGKNIHHKSIEIRKKNLLPGDKIKEFLIEKGLFEEWKQKVSTSLKERWKQNGFHWTGKKHKEDTKKKIGEKLKIAQSGVKNSQYGTCWVYHSESKKNLKVKKEELQTYLTNGYIKGRICK